MAITVGGTTITLNSSSVLQDPPGTAPSFLCRAWVNFNGTGAVAIRANGNVSSITDNGTGDYTVNFATAMPDANYAASASGTERSFGDYLSIAASALRLRSFDDTGSLKDASSVLVIIIR